MSSKANEKMLKQFEPVVPFNPGYLVVATSFEMTATIPEEWLIPEGEDRPDELYSTQTREYLV